MAHNINYSIHDDLSARQAFFIINFAFHAIIVAMLKGQHQHFLLALAFHPLILLIAALLLPPTPFRQDIKELLLFDGIAHTFLFVIYCLPNKLYNNIVDGTALYTTIINTLYYCRLIWPCRDKNGDFVGWPVFGPIGVITKLCGGSRSEPQPNKKQTILAYFSILISILLGWQFYLYGIKPLAAASYFGVAIAVLFAIKKSVVAHKTRVAAEAARIQAEQEKLAHERAEAARLAQLQMQNNLDALLATDAQRSRAETIEEELAREKAEKAAMAEKLAAFEAMHTPEADRALKGLQALPEEARLKQMRVIEALEREMTYFDAEDK